MSDLVLCYPVEILKSVLAATFNMSAARSCGKKITQCLSRNPSDMETEGEWDWTTLMDRFWQGTGGCDYVHECVFEPAFQGEELSCRR